MRMPTESLCAVCGSQDDLADWALAPKSKTSRKVTLCGTCGEPLSVAFKAVRRKTRGLQVTSMERLTAMKSAASPSADEA